MWIAIGGVAIVVLIACLTTLTIWVFTHHDNDYGGEEDGEEGES